MKRSVLLAALLTLAAGVPLRAQQQADTGRFDHARHAKLFPSCVSCHAGAQDPGLALYPAATVCATCHDGTLRSKVSWTPPAAAPASNLRFAHDAHRAALARQGKDSATCVTCHAPSGARWMTSVRFPVPESCVGCHAPGGAHLTQTDSACTQCHVTLAASRLSATEVAKFPAPPSHRDSAFTLGGGHGRAAKASNTSCALCHAQDFCATCHANAATVPAILTLAADPRSLALKAPTARPSSHSDPRFDRKHGALARRSGATCSTCHSQESCTTCHQGTVPDQVRRLAAAVPGRPSGAILVRRPPPTHQDPSWKRSHGADAAARPQSCSACHARSQCLECHRPDAGAATGYHPAGFLTRHPAEAYARESSCAECHNTRGFCQDCHRTAGVTAAGPLKPGFHDAQGAFLLSHGQAARQGLETCVSCHAERDCLTCHSATGGRGFDPHGPGFDAAQLRKKNPTMCVACHGTNIPSK